MKTDMSPEAVTLRLRQTAELRRLCLALAGRRMPGASGADGRDESPDTHHPAPEADVEGEAPPTQQG